MTTEIYPHIADHARSMPDKPALVMSDGLVRLTFAELDARSHELARQIAGYGVGFGGNIAILMGNRPEYAIAAWAAQRSGLHYTPVNWHLTDGEAAYILSDCAASVLLTSPEHLPLIEKLAGQLPGLHVLICDPLGSGAFSDMSGTTPAAVDYAPLEGQMLAYSSGTSGKPKGISRPIKGDPLGTLNAGDTLLRGMYGFAEDTVLLIPAPLYHTAPCAWMVAAQRCGGTVVLMEHFDAAEALAAIARERVTHSWFVPTMFIRLLRLPPDVRAAADLSSLRQAIHSAAPCPVDVKAAMIEWFGPRLYEFYAASEGNGFVAIDSEEWLAHPGSVGRSDKVRILDDEGALLPAGQVGQVFFTAGLVAFEYRGDDAKTAESRSREGWTTVGDMGYVDADNWLYLTDRKSHMIISGGVNIYPQEAENVLTTHPDVYDVAVIGVPHPEYGEEVRGVVQLNPGVPADDGMAAQLLDYCQTRLAKFKCPRKIDFVDELPRLPTGKLLKRQLRDRYASAPRQEPGAAQM